MQVGFDYKDKIRTIETLTFALDGLREIPAILITRGHAESMSPAWHWMCEEIDRRRTRELDDALRFLQEKFSDAIIENKPGMVHLAYILAIMNDLNQLRL